MSFLDNISKTIVDVGQSTLKKGKGVMDSAKYNSMISDEEKKIQKLFEEIGTKYYENFSDSADEMFSQLIADIKACKEKIEEYSKTLESLKGVSKCPKCGAVVPQGSSFCAACGSAIESPPQKDENCIKCSECGATIPIGCKFCTSCGKPIEESSNEE